MKTTTNDKKSELKMLADDLEMKLVTLTDLSKLILDNSSQNGSDPGPYLDARMEGAVMQAQVYISESAFKDYCQLMSSLEVTTYP